MPRKRGPRQPDSHEVELRKRELKRSDGIILKGVDVSGDLLDKIPTEQLTEILGPRIGQRDLISAAVSNHLAELVRALRQLGIRRTPKGRQRPRKFDVAAWQCLEIAEEISGLPKVVLLRACLSLMAEGGGTRVDLQASRNELLEIQARDGQRKAEH
jgi:hypothetical protein